LKDENFDSIVIVVPLHVSKFYRVLKKLTACQRHSEFEIHCDVYIVNSANELWLIVFVSHFIKTLIGNAPKRGNSGSHRSLLPHLTPRIKIFGWVILSDDFSEFIGDRGARSAQYDLVGPPTPVGIAVRDSHLAVPRFRRSHSHAQIQQAF
jgi:hypothetical protein